MFGLRVSREKPDTVPAPWSLYSLAEDRHESSKLYIVVSINEVDKCEAEILNDRGGLEGLSEEVTCQWSLPVSVGQGHAEDSLCGPELTVFEELKDGLEGRAQGVACGLRWKGRWRPGPVGSQEAGLSRWILRWMDYFPRARLVSLWLDLC